ncbi:MAG: putative zinc-binding dehydrogenase [Candidatus Ozemobacter sibiricus]|uniref:Putative zinc-binding dehydrogenase n=1 Tax=Candidatus Ozemobacter sibiricus TaxID=2268124 RepID=A0A367ZKT3_9BACT|nr:MAG: putative zinc-binding dehydrogenase [Candidatus Ozemobacter sibiricus]
MRQILQNLKSGEILLADVPVPQRRRGHLLIRTTRTLISLGTERMLLDFGRAGWLEKARQQPDKVRQVLQKIRTDGLLPTVDAVFRKLDQPLPLGYSHAGVVVEAGPDTPGFRVGDRVVSNGPHAEVVSVPIHLCARIPDNVSDETACFTVVSAIALQGIRLLQPTLGESIGLLGLGLLGLLSVQLLRAQGCRVIGFDFDPDKVALARRFGAEAWNLADGTDPVQAARDFSRGHGVDGVLITAATRSNEPMQQAPQMCRKRGKVVLVGVTGLQLSRDDFYKKEISFQVSCSYGPGRYDPAYEQQGLDYPIGFVRWTEERNFQAVLDLMAAGGLRTDELVSRRVPIAAAHEAYAAVAAGENLLGIVLEYDGSVDLARRAVPLGNPAARPVEGKIGVGFIGAGNFAASTLVPAFREAGAELLTIASAGGVSGSHLGGKYGFRTTTTDHRQVLDDPAIAAVVITTQHASHAKFVQEALAAGKHVFVEKPLCLSHAELEAVIAAWRAANDRQPTLLMVGFNRRFAPLTRTCQRLLAGLPGPRSLIMTVNAGAIPAEHWTQDAAAGGGRLLGEACHFIDLLRAVVGQPITGVQTVAARLPDEAQHPPDVATITLSFADGSLGTVHYFANGHKDFPKERLEIFGGGRILQLDNFKSLTGFGWPNFRQESLWSQDKGHQAQVAAFLAAIKEGRPSPIPFEEIVEVTRATLEAAGHSDRPPTPEEA